MSEATDSSVQQQSIPRVDKEEFDEAFAVFSKGRDRIDTNDLPVFFKSLGLASLRGVVEERMKNDQAYAGQTELKYDTLQSLITEVTSTSHTYNELHWPSDDDVMEAFSVFDQEGLGYIPVQQLKRFLLQAQLGFKDEEELEQLIRDSCRIDGDDQIYYPEFVQNIRSKFTQNFPHSGHNDEATS